MHKLKKEYFLFNTREIVFGALCLAMAFVLSYIKLFSMPFGGAITLASTMPLIIYCHYNGWFKGFVICLAFLLLCLLQGFYIVSVWSFLLDYILPNLAFCIIGIFPAKTKWLIVSCCIVFCIRYFSVVLSGVIFWSQGISFSIWQGDLVGNAAWQYSLVYNIAYMLPDSIIAFAVAFILKKYLHNTFFDSFKNNL